MDRRHPTLSTLRQCSLLAISRSSLYYRPRGVSQEGLALMKRIDRQYLATPFYGSRGMKVWLNRDGHRVNRKRARRLMRTMGLTAVYRRPRTSWPAPGHKVYPYLLRVLEVTRPNSFRGRMGGGHHLYPHGQRIPLLSGHHGLVQQARGGREGVQRPGR